MIKIYLDDVRTPIEWESCLTFPGGEPHIQFSPYKIPKNAKITIDARVTSANDMMMLLAAADALGDFSPSEMNLFIPYFPGARQDRREPGGALTARIYADMINACMFDRVTIVDPHSDVITALVNNSRVVTAERVISSIFTNQGFWGDFQVPHYVIAPDRGAEKRASQVAKFLKCDLVFGKKKRDPKTGVLSGFELEDLPGKGRYLVVDDICDGGGTFLGLADAFWSKAALMDTSLELWVTHGIFSKGVHVLKNAYSRIYSTNSFTSMSATFGYFNFPINHWSFDL